MDPGDDAAVDADVEYPALAIRRVVPPIAQWCDEPIENVCFVTEWRDGSITEEPFMMFTTGNGNPPINAALCKYVNHHLRKLLQLHHQCDTGFS